MKDWTTARWKKELWKVFSKYIRTRDKGICYTSGRFCEGSGYHAGHYIPQSTCGLEALFDERFVRGQSYRDNMHLSGNSVVFRKHLIRDLGEDVVLEFENTYHRPCKWTAAQFQEKIEHYKAKTEQLTAL